MLANTLLILGLIFPVLSWFTAVGGWVHYRTTGRYASPVLVPFIGPILLTAWIFAAGRSPWWIPVVWLADIGTVAFAIVMPRLLREGWRTSRFTLTKTLRGVAGNESVILTLHRDCYVLRKSWRSDGDPGPVGWSEPGTFVDHGERIELIAHHGRKRELQRLDERSYRVVELDAGPQHDDTASLAGWRLHA